MKPSRNTEDTANETPQQPYLGAIIHSIILARLLLDKHSSRPGRVYKEEHTEVATEHTGFLVFNSREGDSTPLQ